MDNGEVIPALNEGYTLAGAKIGEWVCGMAAFLIASEFGFWPPAKHMPELIAIVLITTFSMAGARRSFPDEERGIMNAVATKAGFAPPKIPIPAKLQPYWSGAPAKGLKPTCLFAQLGLEELFVAEGNSQESQAVEQVQDR